MFKEKLIKISMRIFYVIFAVIVSITLWMYVEITENDVQVIDVSGIEIDFKNEEVLRDRGLLITSVTPEQLSFRLEATRADISRLTASGAMSVEVDLSTITSAGPSELSYNIIFPPLVSVGTDDILGRSAARITVMVDTLRDRQVQVRSSYTGGTASEELEADSVVFDPHSITIWGPERVVSRIQYVRVPIYRENLTTTYTDELEFLLIDVDGEILDDELRESLVFSQETIRVTVPIREIKEVPLVINLAHGASTSDANTSWDIEPAVIKLSGDPEAIRDLNQITLGSTIDMLLIERPETTMAFPIIIPNHLFNVSGETEAVVHIKIMGLSIDFQSTSNLHVTNIPSGYTANILTQSLVIAIRGTTDHLALVTPMNLRVVADLAGMSPGTTRVRANVYIDGLDADIDPVGEYFLTVSIIPE